MGAMHVSVAFLADISLMSPRKLLISMIKNIFIGSKYLKKNVFFEKKCFFEKNFTDARVGHVKTGAR